MKKLFIIVILLVGPFSAFADELCGQTWESEGRAYIDGADGMTDVEVLIPAHASKNVADHFRKNRSAACLVGKSLNVGDKDVFVAVDLIP